MMRERRENQQRSCTVLADISKAHRRIMARESDWASKLAISALGRCG